MNNDNPDLTSCNRKTFLSQQEEMSSYIETLIDKRRKQKSWKIKWLYNYFFK